MGSESIAHQVEGHESERNNSFSKIQLVGQMLSQCTQIAQVSAKAATLKSSMSNPYNFSEFIFLRI